MSEFDPFRARDCLLLVDVIRNTITAHTSPDGCISPHGAKLIAVALEGMEIKLGGARRGPTAVK